MDSNSLAAYNRLFDVIKYALWNTGIAAADQEIYDEMKTHAIAALPGSVLMDLSLSPELLKDWEKEIVRHVAQYYHFVHAQSVLPISVPYVILKGTSAAQYYPYPEYRAMGDIDIMTRREDYEAACQMLLAHGYKEIIDEKDTRHREFEKRNIIVEVHAYFASLNDPAQAKYLDDLIIENINPSHVLPDLVNGLVLLEHISQHMEHGLGLRQIIDWMMFVDKCLPDEKWPEFQVMAENIGLIQLAKVSTRMCEMYLGLPFRKWCSDVDEVLCLSLIDYIFNCGNFGNKWKEEGTRSKLITYSRSPKAALELFMDAGVQNWKAAQKYRILRPLAVMYQAGRYFLKGITQKGSVFALKSELDEAKQRNKMFDALGVKQRSKGLVVYKDGMYVKR